MTISKFPARRGIGLRYPVVLPEHWPDLHREVCCQKRLSKIKILEELDLKPVHATAAHPQTVPGSALLRYPAQAVTMQRRVIERTQAHGASTELDAADSTWFFHDFRCFRIFDGYWLILDGLPFTRVEKRFHSLDPWPTCLPGEWSRGWKACGYRHRGWHAEHSGHSCCACQGWGLLDLVCF